MPDPGLPVAFLLGLFSSVHCWSMCGGIAAAMGLSLPEPVRRDRRRLLLFITASNTGRILSYSLAGLLAGLLGHVVAVSAAGHGLFVLQLLAGLVLVLLGMQMAANLPTLAWLERAGYRLWQHIQPLGRKLLPPDHPLKMLALGALWGWLPCGMVYTALLLAAASASPVNGLLVMAAFGLGTLPALIVAGYTAGQLQHWLGNRAIRITAGLVLIAFGLLLPLLHLSGMMSPGHAEHMH